MAITAGPLLDEEDVPIAVLTADTAAAIDQLRVELAREPGTRSHLLSGRERASTLCMADPADDQVLRCWCGAIFNAIAKVVALRAGTQ